MSAYPMGATVRYTARREVGQDEGGPLTASGPINGEPITDDEGRVVFVPVWTERDRGREPTTVYVAVANIIAVETEREAGSPL